MTISIDFDRPRGGSICCKANDGDKLSFEWGESHNLYELPDRASYDSCNFGSATQLATAGPNTGVEVTLTRGEHFFACSKICQRYDHKVRICVLNGIADCSDCEEDCGSGSDSFDFLMIGVVGGVVLLLCCVAGFCCMKKNRTEET